MRATLDAQRCYLQVRVWLAALVNSEQFDRGVMLLIVANTIAMLAPLFEYPQAEERCDMGNDDACRFARGLFVIDLFFVGAFTLEVLLKTLAWGLLTPYPTAYLRDGWNKLDFLVVTMGWLPLLLPQLSNYSALRALRALRPLRAINRLPAMRKQVNTLIDSLPQLAGSGWTFAVRGGDSGLIPTDYAPPRQPATPAKAEAKGAKGKKGAKSPAAKSPTKQAAAAATPTAATATAAQASGDAASWPIAIALSDVSAEHASEVGVRTGELVRVVQMRAEDGWSRVVTVERQAAGLVLRGCVGDGRLLQVPERAAHVVPVSQGLDLLDSREELLVFDLQHKDSALELVEPLLKHAIDLLSASQGPLRGWRYRSTADRQGRSAAVTSADQEAPNARPGRTPDGARRGR